MDYKQLTLFENEDNKVETETKEQIKEAIKEKKISVISERIIDEFGTLQIPFIGCNYDLVYPQIVSILPSEKISFVEFGFEECIACELICASICHQINWDFLRKAVFDKTQKSTLWLNCKCLSTISGADIYEMLKSYDKKDRIRAEERAELLRQVGKTICEIGNYSDIFFDSNSKLLSYENIRNHLLSCTTFSRDPSEKKFQLLLQKLSNLHRLKDLNLYYKPAIDYHLVRCYLRRGLIFPKTQYAERFISNPIIQRKESTVGALRQLCSEVLEQICCFTSLNTSSVNLVEWHIGRSICTQENPDCFLQGKNSAWIKKIFQKCPFYDSCVACQYRKDYLALQEPTYDGTSY